jgi:chaperonin GroEL
LKNVAAGANPMDLKRGIDKWQAIVTWQNNQKSCTDSDKIKQSPLFSIIMTVIGDLIATLSKVEKRWVSSVEEAKGTETYVDVVEGMQFDRGYLSPFCNYS